MTATPQSILDTEYADACVLGLSPLDPQFGAVLSEMHAEADTRAESEGTPTERFWTVVSRCVAAHHYDDNGWRP